jgi:hypothetical protein
VSALPSACRTRSTGRSRRTELVRGVSLDLIARRPTVSLQNAFAQVSWGAVGAKQIRYHCAGIAADATSSVLLSFQRALNSRGARPLVPGGGPGNSVCSHHPRTDPVSLRVRGGGLDQCRNFAADLPQRVSLSGSWWYRVSLSHVPRAASLTFVTAGQREFVGVAEVDGNRTRLARVPGHTGVEDREGHQPPEHLRRASLAPCESVFVTERSEGIIRFSRARQGGSPRSGDPA